MASLASVKVRVGDELRRFTVARTATWAEVEARLQALLGVPTLAGYTVGYTDEDGDNVVIGSDAELRELLARPTPLRLNVDLRRTATAPRATSPATSEDGVRVERNSSDDDDDDDNHEDDDVEDDGFVALPNATAAPASTTTATLSTAAATATPVSLTETVLVESVPDQDDAPAAAAAPAASATASAPAPAASASSSKQPPAADPFATLWRELDSLVQTAVERNGDLIERGGQLMEQWAREAAEAQRAHAERVHAARAAHCAAWQARRAAWIATQQQQQQQQQQQRQQQAAWCRRAGKAPVTDDDEEDGCARARACGGGRCAPRQVVHPYADRLALLAELGFDDTTTNVHLLTLFGGNVAAVVNALVA
jgi:hypothetical protein